MYKQLAPLEPRDSHESIDTIEIPFPSLFSPKISPKGLNRFGESPARIYHVTEDIPAEKSSLAFLNLRICRCPLQTYGLSLP